MRNQPEQAGGAADGVYYRASGGRLAIISQPGASRAEKKTLVVAAVRFVSKMTHNGHHSVLKPADIPAYASVEDRYMDLSTREVHWCVSLQSKGRKSFELQHYAWMGMDAGIRVWILTMPHVDQNLQVTSLFFRHTKEQGCKECTSVFSGVGQACLPAVGLLSPNMAQEVLSSESLIQRLTKLKYDDPEVQALRQKGILTTENAWNYLSWDSAAKCLRPTKKAPLPHEKIQELTIQLSQLASQSDLIQRFSALKHMNRDQIPDDSQGTIPWRLDLSLRSAASTQLFDLLNTLRGNGICQLILLRLRPTGVQRSPLAAAIAHRVRR